MLCHVLTEPRLLEQNSDTQTFELVYASERKFSVRCSGLLIQLFHYNQCLYSPPFRDLDRM